MFTDASHQCTLANPTCLPLLAEAAHQVAHLQQHSGDAHMMLNVTPDMFNTNWIGSVHRNVQSIRNRLQLLHQRIDELDRGGHAREQDLVHMSMLQEAMHAIKDAQLRLQSRWKCYNRKKKQRR